MDCFGKVIECLDEHGERRVLQGKRKPISVRLILAMQTKRSNRKGCVLFVVKFCSIIEANSSAERNDNDILTRYPILN